MGVRAASALPVWPGALIGRDREVADLSAVLATGGARLLTLTGPPGSGKTRLAAAAAAAAADSFPDGTTFVDLSGVRDPSRVIPTVLDTLEVIVGPHRSPFDALRQRLRAAAALLVLDNFEQVLVAAPSISDLLAACPALHVLVTSREPLRLRWEREWPVSPLALPGVGARDDELRGSPAVQLFVERTGAEISSYSSTDGRLRAVADIVRRLDGLPLAIELAAPLARTIDTPQIADLLTRDLGSSRRDRAMPRNVSGR